MVKCNSIHLPQATTLLVMVGGLQVTLALLTSGLFFTKNLLTGTTNWIGVNFMHLVLQLQTNSSSFSLLPILSHRWKQSILFPHPARILLLIPLFTVSFSRASLLKYNLEQACMRLVAIVVESSSSMLPTVDCSKLLTC